MLLRDVIWMELFIATWNLRYLICWATTLSCNSYTSICELILDLLSTGTLIESADVKEVVLRLGWCRISYLNPSKKTPHWRRPILDFLITSSQVGSRWRRCSFLFYVTLKKGSWPQYCSNCFLKIYENRGSYCKACEFILRCEVQVLERVFSSWRKISLALYHLISEGSDLPFWPYRGDRQTVSWCGGERLLRGTWGFE